MSTKRKSKDVQAPTESELVEVTEQLRKRSEPLNQALAEWQAWSRIRLILRKIDSVEGISESLSELVLAVRAAGHDDMWAAIEGDLLVPTRKCIAMLRSGDSAANAAAYLRTWDGRPGASAVWMELASGIWDLVEQRLDVAAHVAEAASRVGGPDHYAKPRGLAEQKALGDTDQPKRRARYRRDPPPGWLYLKEAAQHFKMNSKTLHYHRSKLSAEDVRTDAESREVMVRLEAMEARLEKVRGTDRFTRSG